MKEKYIKDCPCWVSQYFFNKDINFKEPYNKDTLEYLDTLFYQGLIQKIYSYIKTEYKNPEVQKALFKLIVEAWNGKIKYEKLQ